MSISKIVQNSISDTVQLGRDLIFKPIITSPANNATGINNDQLLTATPFLSLYGVAQANAEWQISTSPTFAHINVNSSITGSNTEFQANASSGLIENTIHYARVRYSDTSNNSSEYSDTVQFTTASQFSFNVRYLVVAGGGGGGSAGAGGGAGAGGFLTGTISRTIADSAVPVTVGGGGAASVYDSVPGTNGSNSVFSSFTSIGGGRGGNYQPPYNGLSGGSGGGGQGGTSSVGGAGTTGQGFAGGNATGGANYGSGGGGGAAAPGGGGNGSAGGVGGAGASSDITGSEVFYAGGGGGGIYYAAGGVGGVGGGGNANAGSGQTGNPGATNKGGGGGGGGSNGSNLPAGGAGGSGVVILRYPDSYTISNPGGGLVFTTATAGGFKVTTFTSGTGNVSWS